MITQIRIKQLLNYNPSTGIFTWISKGHPRCNIKIGAIAGSRRRDGYVAIRIDKRPYLAHRLAWLYMTGEWPKSLIDHKNLDCSDNRLENLRASTFSQNGFNRKANKNNLIGLKGVCRERRTLAFYAQISIKGKRIHLGTFDCPAAAHLSYVVAADKFHGEFARAE